MFPSRKMKALGGEGTVCFCRCYLLSVGPMKYDAWHLMFPMTNKAADLGRLPLPPEYVMAEMGGDRRLF